MKPYISLNTLYGLKKKISEGCRKTVQLIKQKQKYKRK